jgi:hypothetical protein
MDRPLSCFSSMELKYKCLRKISLLLKHHADIDFEMEYVISTLKYLLEVSSQNSLFEIFIKQYT